MDLPYEKVASELLKQNEAITIEKLSLLTSISTTDLKEILTFFKSQGFLKHGDDFNKILLTEKARSK